MEPSPKTGIYRHEAILVFFIGILLLVPGIWCETGITGQDEYWLSFRTPMESLERGDWLTPWVNGEPRLKKPPLLYWAVMLSYRLLGINLFAARIWGVLAGAGLAACSTLLYRELFRKSGLLAGLITLGCISLAIEGRRAMLDLPLAWFTAMAIFFAIRWGRSGRCRWILLSALCLGLSFLVKGPVGIILFCVAAFTGLLVFRKWEILYASWRQLFLASVLLLVVALAWPFLMAFRWPEFLKIVDSEVAARGIGTIHLGSPFSTLGGAFGLVFPWSLILLAALTESVVRFRESGAKKGLWLTTWFLGCVVPFMFIRSFARYMTPLIPAASILCANWLGQAAGRCRAILLRLSVSILALASLSFCLFFLWFGLGLAAATASLAVTGFMLWLAFSGKDVRLVAASVAVLLSLLMGALYPSLGVNAMPAGLEEALGRSPVASYNSSQPSMLSVRIGRSVVRIRSFSKEDLKILNDFDGFVFVRREDMKGFEDLASRLGILYHKAGSFRTFYSRKAWIRFARADADIHDWKTALKERSLEGLKPEIIYYRVRPQARKTSEF